MTYRGSLPTGQPGFPDQQQDHQQMYGGAPGGYQQQHQPQFQQQPHMSPQQSTMYANGVGGGQDQFYGGQQGQFLPQQHQQHDQQQYAQQQYMRMRQEQQQNAQHRQPVAHFMSGGGSTSGRYNASYGAGQMMHFAHQSAHVQQQPMWPQPVPHQRTQPQQYPQMQQQMASDEMMYRMYQQQQQQQQMRSPQVHQQPSPQPRASPLLPSQLQRKHSMQGLPQQHHQQQIHSPIQQQLQQQFQSPPQLQGKQRPQPQPQPHRLQSQSQSPHLSQHHPTPPPAPTQTPQQQQHQYHQYHQQQQQPEKQHLAEPEPLPVAEPEPVPEPEPQLQPDQQTCFQPETQIEFETIPDPPSEPPPLEIQEPINFVNPLDIFNAPPPAPLLPMPMGNLQSFGKREPESELKPSLLEDESVSIARVPSPKSMPSPTVKADPVIESDTIIAAVPKRKSKSEPKLEQVRIKSSPHSSVTNSPALSTKSPGIVKRSPAPKPRPVNTIPVMVAIAEECIDKARSSVHDVAMSLDAEQVDEYQKLISTSLSCLEAAMQNSKLAPREEARLRMRYAALLQEETDNVMEAELALGKGISLCDKHRLIDLKYCMQYLMLKVLFQRNHKAALKAVDGHISDCEAFKHVQWYYAFRLLKSTFFMAMGNASDASALENIRAVQSVANTRGDNAMSVFASLLEGMALLKSSRDGNIERVHACIAQAAKFQFDPTVKILQLDMLTLLLDFASSLHHLSPDTTAQKLRVLQQRLDECEEWHNVKADFLIPVKKQPSSAKTVSEETSAIIRPGSGSVDDGVEHDYMVMTFMTKMELRALVFTFSGLANLHKPSSSGRRSTEFWLEGAKILETWDAATAGIPYGPSVSLATAVRHRSWRAEAQVYLNVLLGLLASSHCQWDKVKHFMTKLEALINPSTQPTVRLLSIYLKGVHHQGTGDLQGALQVFQDPCFDIPQSSPSSLGGANRAGQREIALLAGLNRLWIMQHQSVRNDQLTQELIEQLQPYCTNHWNIDLSTAWHNVVAALETDPPQQLNQQKQHIQAAMSGSKVTNNILGAAVTLCIMRSRFFENVIGEQALKSARAASKQAQRSGNMLWQSVADGMLAQSYEVQGQRDESSQEWEKATKEARDAFAGSW